MLWPIFVLLLILWLAGVVANYTLGGYIHVLLALAVLVLLAQVIKVVRHPAGAQARETKGKDSENAGADDERVA